MVKYVLFDFDGTLADSRKVMFNLLNALAVKYGFKQIEPEEVPYLRTLSIAERCRYLNFPMYKIPFMAVELSRQYGLAIKDLILFEGIREMLDALVREGYQLGILSSNSENNIRAFLQYQGITHIQLLYCSHHIFGKDRLLKKMIKQHRLQPAEVLYVGDELRDIVACQKSGVKVVWVEWGYDAYEAVRQHTPDYIAQVPTDILRALSINPL